MHAKCKIFSFNELKWLTYKFIELLCTLCLLLYVNCVWSNVVIVASPLFRSNTFTILGERAQYSATYSCPWGNTCVIGYNPKIPKDYPFTLLIVIVKASLMRNCLLLMVNESWVSLIKKVILGIKSLSPVFIHVTISASNTFEWNSLHINHVPLQSHGLDLSHKHYNRCTNLQCQAMRWDFHLLASKN